MRREVVLITGASGEVGHGLITHLAENTDARIVALDIQPLGDDLVAHCHEFILGDILDVVLLGRIVLQYEIRTIYHLASILSTSAEYNPEAAHRVNVEGTLNLLHLAIEQSRWQGKPVKFLYPSSIAAYGIPNLETKAALGPVEEGQYCSPTTMYGCNKLYCEHLGRYYAQHYKQLAADREPHGVDFRCLRYPGLISATTIPMGGTSDYGPEMLHHAAQGKPYQCFVRPDAQLPFMVMPDAIKALTLLERANRESLSRHVYNVTSFSLSANQFMKRVKAAFADAVVDFEPDISRQEIVDSWPADLNDTAAREEWEWEPDYGVDRAFDEYLVPTITKRYAKSK
ncbi:MAG: NAD-dependent epimerase/dehydratase family protein [Anaerolineales bacterium]|nr:NAD-dependent epimerase/dehydratase family protein [Anaerolineales bacterium]